MTMGHRVLRSVPPHHILLLLILLTLNFCHSQNSIAEGIGSIFNVRRGSGGSLLPDLFSVDVKFSNLTLPDKIVIEFNCTKNKTINLDHSIHFTLPFSVDLFLYVISGSIILLTTFAFAAVCKYILQRPPTQPPFNNEPK